MPITIRPARLEDAPFVALVMAEAVGNDIMERSLEGVPEEDRPLMKRLAMLSTRTDTLYSYQNTLIAEDEGGTPVGGLISYPGDNYLECRKLTFGLIDYNPGPMDAETQPGEYYLDSLAVLPHHRGRGIARQLLLAGIQKAGEMHRPAILACAPENVGAKRLYESLGFRERGHLFIFGENYLRMVR